MIIIITFFCCSKKLVNPSAIRNREPILEILKNHFGTGFGTALEISSGVGNHVEHFAPNFPKITFQPSEFDQSNLNSIQAYADDCPTKNILPPILIDVRDSFTKWGSFYPDTIDFMININMIHITEFSCAEGLFRNAGALLKPNGLLITYGPYAENGILTPESNKRFDAGLRSQNREWGVRDIADLERLAKQCSIYLKDKYEMPANNKLLIWQKNNTFS